MAVPEVSIDIIEDARLREENGIVVEVVRVAIIKDVALPPTPKDYILKSALATLGIPAHGASHPFHTGLFVRRREVTAMGHAIARVMLFYERDDVGQPAGDTVLISGGTAVEQIETALDRAGNQITVTHGGIPQGGEIHPFEARDSITLTWTEQSAAPGALTRAYTNKVNTGPWQFDGFAAARTWHVAEFTFELADGKRVPPLYRMQASFRHNDDGIDPQIVYIDPETGRPPAGLVANVGYKTIQWYDAVDFDNIFP